MRVGDRSALLALAFTCSLAVPASPQQFDEYTVKSEFLSRFALFITWPEEAFATDEDPLIVGVVGDDPFGPRLAEAIEERRAGGRALQAWHYPDLQSLDPGAADTPHILFVPRDMRSRYDEILEQVGGRPILTVGEDPAFTRAGGLMNILIEDGSPVVELALERAREVGFEVRAELAAVARIVDSSGPGEAR